MPLITYAEAEIRFIAFRAVFFIQLYYAWDKNIIVSYGAACFIGVIIFYKIIVFKSEVLINIFAIIKPSITAVRTLGIIALFTKVVDVRVCKLAETA